MLLGGREASVERDHLGDGQLHPVQGVGGVADLPLAGEEDEDVAARPGVPLGPQLLDGLADAGHHVALLGLGTVGVDERAVADLDGEGAARDLDDRGRLPRGRVGEVLGEALGVDRRRGDDDLEVRAPREQLLEVAEDEVDVEAALVGLVDDDRVVAAQVAVALHLGEQDAVGHDLDEGVAAALVGEADLVADGGAELDGQLLGQALGDGAGRDAPRLGVADDAVEAPAELEADLRDLGRLARAGLSGDDDDLVVADRGRDVVAPVDDGQVLGIGDRRNRGRPRGAAGLPLLRCQAAATLAVRSRAATGAATLARLHGRLGPRARLGRRLARGRSATTATSGWPRARGCVRGLVGHGRQDRRATRHAPNRYPACRLTVSGCRALRIGRGHGNAAPTRVVRGATTGHQRTYRGPTRRSEAPLSDPDRLRPALPDPQQDRHVSFPDDAPDDVSNGAPRPVCRAPGRDRRARPCRPRPGRPGRPAMTPRGRSRLVGPHRCRRRSPRHRPGRLAADVGRAGCCCSCRSCSATSRAAPTSTPTPVAAAPASRCPWAETCRPGSTRCRSTP